MNRLTLVFVIACSLVAGCTQESTPEPSQETTTVPATAAAEHGRAQVNEDRIAKIEQDEPGAWLTYGRNYEEQRFSPLKQVNKESIDELGIAWFKDLDTSHGVQGTPLVIDGVIYASAPFNVIYALDAKTGEELWRFDAEVPKAHLRKACCGANSRGIAAYEGKIYTATLDGRLIAIDAGSGQAVWEVDTIIDRSRNYSDHRRTASRSAARCSSAMAAPSSAFGVMSLPMTPRPASTPGASSPSRAIPLARLRDIPAMELAAKTWKGGEWWKIGGGGTVWNCIVYDPEFNQLYLGVGNGAPWTRVIRFSRRRRQSVPRLDRRGRLPTPASTSGTTRRPRATTGTTPPSRT